MKKLAEFKDEKSIEVAAKVLGAITDILGNKKNLKQKNEKNPFKMFSAFMQNSPKEMMRLFAILSDKEDEYHCDGNEALMNMLKIVDDPLLISLFISQSQTGDATSSGSVSENTEE